MDEKIQKLFENFKFVPIKETVLIGRLPQELIVELDIFVDECRKIKDNTLSFLKKHHNRGNNTYQVSVPPRLLEDSFLFPYLNYLGEYYLSKELKLEFQELFRKVCLRRHYGHFDNYDFWINFCNKESINEKHSHGGTLSGVIYYSNNSEERTCFEEFEVIGQKGDILIFPSHLIHWVNQQNVEEERITFSFNLVYDDS